MWTLVLTLFAFAMPLPPGQAKTPPAGTAEHNEALARAQVWFEPDVPIDKARLRDNPPAPRGQEDQPTFAPDEEVSCTFKPGFTSGSTPKFECERREGQNINDGTDGKDIKVKYGRDNKEIYAEVVASRLLTALGFPTDRMYVVKRVRCFGCPPDPFKGLECLNEGKTVPQCFGTIDYTRFADFTYAVIERRLEGEKLETKKVRGWGWNELATIDPAVGGAPRAQVDALRLMAVFLNHWDNKPKNQRLLCPGEKVSGDALPECRRPVAMVQDLGGTFGPFKFDVIGWAKSPIWQGPTNCMVSMRNLPYGGSSFPDTQISEEGRLFLGSRLGKLSHQQIVDLFEGARAGRQTAIWVRAFERKVASIVNHAPCPATP
jgi:hypothetical protein